MRSITPFAVVGILAVASACGGPSTGPSGGMGSLTVMLRDSPYSDAQSLLVTFSEVSVHRSDQANDAWTRLAFADGATARTCDLKKLQTAQDVLGAGPLAAGHYTQIRLVVSSGSLFFDNAATGNACAAAIPAPSGRSAVLEIPSGEVKLNREFDVDATSTTTILLDFNGDQSVHATGNGRFLMTPVIGIVSVQ